MDKHPTQKTAEELASAQQDYDRYLQLIETGAVDAPSDILQSPAYLRLKDAKRAAEFSAQCADMDETAGLRSEVAA